jgi:hypothetical protein
VNELAKVKIMMVASILAFALFIGSMDAAHAFNRSTIGIQKSYQNLFGDTMARHTGYTQWDWQNGQVLRTGSLWQDVWTGVGYWHEGAGQKWDWNGGTVAQARHWVTFKSGLPTPWGNVGGSTLHSNLTTQVNGWGGHNAW